MRKLIIISGLGLLSLTFLRARASGTDGTAGIAPPAQALQFSLPDPLSIGPFLGESISYLQMRSTHSAIRLGADFTFKAEITEYEGEDPYRRGRRRQIPEPSSVLAISGWVHYLIYGPGIHRLSLYYGGGPSLSIGLTEQKYYDGDWLSQRNVETQIGIGTQGVIGISLSVTPSLELFADYITGFTYESTKGETTNYSDGSRVSLTQIHTSTCWKTQPNGALLGLSLYFK